MHWIDVLIGICLLTLGIIWLSYQLKETKKYRKDNSYALLSTQPSQYIGILILILGGILMIVRALWIKKRFTTKPIMHCYSLNSFEIYSYI